MVRFQCWICQVDHKPTRQDEQSRVLQAGGIVEPAYFNGAPIGPLRVWNKTKESGLAMTRAFGDGKGKQSGVISEPELTQLDLGPNDKFIIIASDGLWDVMRLKGGCILCDELFGSW